MLDDLNAAAPFSFFLRTVAGAPSLLRPHAIRVVGDIAIFVNFDSADVWTIPSCSPQLQLDPEVVAGVLPIFQQRRPALGHPLYRWT